MLYPVPNDLALIARARVLFANDRDTVIEWTSRLFAWLLVLQWLGAVALAFSTSHSSQAGVALGLGALLIVVPVCLAFRQPTWGPTRHLVAVAQMGLGAILIHILNGRIEAHFHVFGSLAFLSFYRDWRVLLTGSAVVVLDHLLRGHYYPQSIYGEVAASQWRWLEHASWVAFEDAFLIVAILRNVQEMKSAARRQAELERANNTIELAVLERTTELTYRTDELRLSEERYRLLFESNPHPLWVHDAVSSQILAVNDSALRLYGFSQAEFLAKTVFDLEVEQPLDVTVPRHGEPTATVLHRHKLASGEVRQIEVAEHPIEFGGGPAFLVLALDVTEKKMLKEQLEQAQKLEAIGQLAAGIAHEINTPIQYIGDNTNFFADTFREVRQILAQYREAGHDPMKLDEARQAATLADLDYLFAETPRAIDQTRDGVKHVARIVKAMKEFAHPGTEEKVPIDLNHAIETVIEVARNEWKYVADVSTNLDPNLPAVPGHPGELNQALLNLLVNAVHAVKAATSKQGHKGKITFWTLQTPTYVEVQISDSGCGIPRTIRGRIFDPFFTTKPVGQGTGQGLAITHAVVVQRHGGIVLFDSEIGKGTTFLVRLPLQGDTPLALVRQRTGCFPRIGAKTA